MIPLRIAALKHWRRDKEMWTVDARLDDLFGSASVDDARRDGSIELVFALGPQSADASRKYLPGEAGGLCESDPVLAAVQAASRARYGWLFVAP
jgi:hypothetical protein